MKNKGLATCFCSLSFSLRKRFKTKLTTVATDGCPQILFIKEKPDFFYRVKDPFLVSQQMLGHTLKYLQPLEGLLSSHLYVQLSHYETIDAIRYRRRCFSLFQKGIFYVYRTCFYVSNSYIEANLTITQIYQPTAI